MNLVKHGKNVKVGALSCSVLRGIRNSPALFEGSQTSSACPSDKSSIKTEMIMDCGWDNTDRGKPKYSEKISYGNFIDAMSHMDWQGKNPGLCSERPATNARGMVWLRRIKSL
jgi:hypothetical protein